MKSSKDWQQVLIYDPARKEILDWPLEIKKDLGSILTKLQKGAEVGYPDTEPMKSVASGCFEIRLKGPDGIYRAFYILKTELGILVFHSFKKKSQKTPKYEIETGKKDFQLLLRSSQMKKNKKQKKNYTIARNSKELAEALGIESSADQALMEYKAQLSVIASKAILNSGLAVNEIVKRSGVARSKVSAIKNGALAGISSDLFIKIISAAGARLTLKMAS